MMVFEKTHALIESDIKRFREVDEFWAVAGPETRQLIDYARSRMPLVLFDHMRSVDDPYYSLTEPFYGTSHLGMGSLGVQGIHFGFAFSHPEIFHRGCRIDLELKPEKRKFAQALARMAVEKPTLGTLLSLTKPVVQTSRVKKPRLVSILDQIRAGAESSNERVGWEFDDLHPEDSFDDLVISLPVSRSILPTDCCVALGIFGALYVAMVSESEEIGSGQPILLQFLNKFLDFGCRPGVRGIPRQNAKRKPTAKGNDGFASKDPIWLTFKPSGQSTVAATIRCNVTHTMLELHGKGMSYFFPSRVSRRAALTAAKRMVTWDLGKGEWTKCDPIDGFAFSIFFPDAKQQELFDSLEPDNLGASRIRRTFLPGSCPTPRS